MDDIAGVVLVLLPQVLEDPDLLLGLPVEPLLVSHHLEGDVLVGLVVVHLEHLAKRALAYHLQDLVPEVKNDFTLFLISPTILPFMKKMVRNEKKVVDCELEMAMSIVNEAAEEWDAGLAISPFSHTASRVGICLFSFLKS